MAKVIMVLGWVLLACGVGFVLFGTAGVAMTEGIWAALQLFNPFNIANFVLTVAVLAPGILFISWGKSMAASRRG